MAPATLSSSSASSSSVNYKALPGYSGEFWFIGAPVAGAPVRDGAQLCRELLSANDFEHAVPLYLPPFQLCSLDLLVRVAERLSLIDKETNICISKHISMLQTLCGESSQQVETYLEVEEVPAPVFLQGFSWNARRFHSGVPIEEMANAFHDEVIKAEALIKNRWTVFNQAKSAKKTLERQQCGNLATLPLCGIVRREHIIPSSECMCTAFVAVPASKIQLWNDSFETISEMVVPRSSRKISEDGEYALFTVVVFRRFKDTFEKNCREFKFIPREFSYNEGEAESNKSTLESLLRQEKDQLAGLLRIAKTTFSVYFGCLCHIKALRTLVECLLRYGLPPNYILAVVHVKKKPDVGRMVETITGALGLERRQSDAGKPSKQDRTLEQEFQDLQIQVGIEGNEVYPFTCFPLVLESV